MQSFQLRNVVKYRIYSPVKFASLIYMFVLPTKKVIFSLQKILTFSARNTNIKNLEILHGHIFCTLPQFAAKLCKRLNFKLLFLAVVKDLPRSKFSLLCEFLSLMT